VGDAEALVAAAAQGGLELRCAPSTAFGEGVRTLAKHLPLIGPVRLATAEV
jgi:hypothetical protein